MPDTNSTQRLTDSQRRQVEQNIGLVGVHLRRHVRGSPQATRDREPDDLFQEGCLGLIQAVRTFRPEAGIPLPAYLLPRIHTAVSNALRNGFSTIRQPNTRRHTATAARNARYPTCITLDFDPRDLRPDPGRELERCRSSETIGQRIRDRYVRSVRRAADRAKRARRGRADRADLIDRIVEQRLLVPEPEARASLRGLARQTDSAYARVAQCEKRLLARVRADLTRDAETQRLRAEAGRHPDGMDASIDGELEAELEQVHIDSFLDRLADAVPAQQGAVLLELIKAAGARLETVAGSLARSIPGDRRADLLDDAA